MENLFVSLTDTEVYAWETFLGDWFFYISIALFGAELLRYTLMKRVGWNLIGDSVANSLTFAGYIGLGYLLFYGLYVSSFFYIYQFALFEIPTTWATIAICVVLSDLIYYWEHRFTHRVNIAWATHSVHHSSPHFNLSVAYRFGPLDDFWPIAFYLPLCLIGFNPFVVFFAALFVQLYQTFLHTEAVGKLWWPIEAVMNTPSHHRVHHGANPLYLDRNYGGIFIVWDRMFDTFAREDEPVTYGLVKQIDSVNPIIVFFHGLYDLGRNVLMTPGLTNKLGRIFQPPDWDPKEAAGNRQSVAAE